MKIFLDLEDTVIDTWGAGNPVHTSPVKFFLKLNGVTEVSIFSFAIWSDTDLLQFAKRHKAMLEDLLDVEITQVLSVPQMMQSDRLMTGVHFEDVTEFISLRGKHGAFVNWCLSEEKGQHSILVDDIAPNRVIFDFDTKTKIESINVANINRGLHKGC